MSSIAASGDTAPPADAPVCSPPLRSRVLSALVLGSLALAALYEGFPAFDLLAAVAVAVMAWEWRRLCAGGRFDGPGYLFAVTVVAAVGAAAIGRYGVGFVLLLAGAALVGMLIAPRAGRTALWTVAGVIGVGITGFALVWLRAGPDGLALALWLVVAVWTTDTMAFVVGRAIGGPKLAPTISPNKTWAGLGGGMAGAAAWSVVWALWTDAAQPGSLALLGAGTAILAQLGDLAVSAVKRRFGAKDASRLIPGHGGLLDRVDGLMGAAPVVALAVAVAGGGDMSPWA